MRAGVLINDFATLVASQATALFAHHMRQTTDETVVFGVSHLHVDPRGDVIAEVSTVSKRAETVAEQVAHLRAAERQTVPLADLDRILIRTNPARDSRAWAHDGAFQLLSLVARTGTRVINDPAGLRDLGSKLWLTCVPAWTRPRTVVAHDRTVLERFVRDAPGPIVLKPARGTRGDDVFKVRPDDDNLRVILASLLRQGFVVAQDFVPEASAGDTRVIVLDGAVLEIDNRPAAIHRIPSTGDFRSNVHAGGRAAPGVVTSGMRDAVAAIGPLLTERGIRLAGLDFLGDLVCEINVYSTGGFLDAERFFERPFVAHTVETLLA